MERRFDFASSYISADQSPFIAGNRLFFYVCGRVA